MQTNANCNLINNKIAQFFASDNSKQDLQNVDKYFASNNTLNFREIAQLLREELPQGAEVYSYEHYLRCYHKLLPIFLQGYEALVTCTTVDVGSLWLQWLGNNYKYLTAITLTNEQNGKDSVILEHVLLMTALLENALANVYYTVTAGGTPPHLLRDLLSTEELFTVFGTEAILFLKVLLGTPNSINLRNIVWHGFPRPQQLPAYYASTLLLTIHSFGGILHKQDFIIKERAQVTDFSSCLPKILNQLQLENSFTTQEDLSELVMKCAWLPHDYKLYWPQLFDHYQQQRYWQFVILILPQIELLLRLYYGHVNEYDVSAKLDEYYVTMDTIFECDVPNCDGRKNKLLSFSDDCTEGAVISAGALKCIYDVFIAPPGPRLRDKVSHGEVAMPALNNVALCDILFHLSMNLLTADETKFPLQHFESKFHLNSLTQEALFVGAAQLRQLWKTHLENVEHILDNDDDDDEMLTTRGKIKIFQRPKREAEFMLLIETNCILIKQTCLNYTASIDERLQLLARRELHSKRRRTLERLLTTLPEICAVLGRMIKCFERVYWRLQIDDKAQFEDDEKCKKLQRFLKHTLKFNENLVKYANKNNNEWIKALELCRKFAAIQQQFFIS